MFVRISPSDPLLINVRISFDSSHSSSEYLRICFSESLLIKELPEGIERRGIESVG